MVFHTLNILVNLVAILSPHLCECQNPGNLYLHCTFIRIFDLRDLSIEQSSEVPSFEH